MEENGKTYSLEDVMEQGIVGIIIHRHAGTRERVTGYDRYGQDLWTPSGGMARAGGVGLVTCWAELEGISKHTLKAGHGYIIWNE